MENQNIEFVDWQQGIIEYESIGEKKSFFSDVKFLNATFRERIKVCGYRVEFPHSGIWQFAKQVVLGHQLIVPVHIYRKTITILCDISSYSDYCVGVADGTQVAREFLNGLLKLGFSTIEIPYANFWSKEFAEKEFSSKGNEMCAVCISISNGYDAWKRNLSKSSRQNQRTAYNRIESDSKKLEIKHYHGNISKKELMQQCYLHRCRNVERRKGNCAWYLKPIVAIMALIDLGEKWNRVLLDNPNSYSCMCFIDHKLAAFVSGLIHGETYVIPFLSYNSQFRRYDPGRILIDSSIAFLCENHLAKEYDLYKGTEQYKFDNGGNEYSLLSLRIDKLV